jgi:hypothetical protein
MPEKVRRAQVRMLGRREDVKERADLRWSEVKIL